MIKINNIYATGLYPAIKGIRFSYGSEEKSDSFNYWHGSLYLGDGDLALIRKLIVAGPDHRKFLRQMYVSMEITAPLYWWKQMDTYKVGTTTNSQSTMHTLLKKELTLDDFSFDSHSMSGEDIFLKSYREIILTELNRRITLYKQISDINIKKEMWRSIIQDLPSAFNQKRLWTGNYEVIYNIYLNRSNHKLKEWQDFIVRVKAELPGFVQFIDHEI